MATIHTSNDIGFYVGSLINQNPHSGDILWMIKSALKTAGWTIVNSGDGDLISVPAGDNLTSNARNNGNSGNSPKIPNSICNDGCWFIAKTPNAAPQQGRLCIQLVTYVSGVPNIRAKWSVGGFNSSFLPSFTPGPLAGGDEKLIIGSGTDGAPVGDPILPVGTEFAYRFNMGIDDDAASCRFWTTLWANGSKGNVSSLFYLDFLTGLKAPDVSPYVAAWKADGAGIQPFILLGNYQTIDSGLAGVAGRFGTTLVHKLAAMAPGFSNADVNGNVPAYTRSLVRSLGKQSMTGKECMFPVLYARHTSLAAPLGLKGAGSYLYWSMADRSLADHLDVVGIRDYVYIGDFMAPWTALEKCVP